jgi:hypothetical protein
MGVDDCGTLGRWGTNVGPVGNECGELWSGIKNRNDLTHVLSRKPFKCNVYILLFVF